MQRGPNLILLVKKMVAFFIDFIWFGNYKSLETKTLNLSISGKLYNMQFILSLHIYKLGT